MPSKTCGLAAITSASRGAEDMMLTISDSSAGLLPSSENSWMPEGRPEMKLSKRSSASSARLLSPKTRSS